jgi:pantoate--beta-alanine ligase
MGALHDGHLSLVDASRRENDRTIVSIFVNPLQFGPSEDFARYPRDLAADLAALAGHGADAVFAPRQEEMYPAGASTRVRVDGVGDVLEGAFRPGHFEGVATVVAKLLGAVQPDRAYFGRKDAQQVAVVSKMVEDLSLGVEIRPQPTVREPDGLALSSRNRYLGAAERTAGLSLSRALRKVNDAYLGGVRETAELRRVLEDELASEPLARPDYAELIDPADFSSPGRLAVVAVRIGGTRLIDNHLLGEPFG